MCATNIYSVMIQGGSRLERQSGGYEFPSKEEAVARAKTYLTANPSKPVYVFRAIALVKKAETPIEVIDLAV